MRECTLFWTQIGADHCFSLSVYPILIRPKQTICSQGAPYSHFRSMWDKTLEGAGFRKGDFVFKEIRYCANTALKSANIPADKRMMMTGHKSIQANEVYTHPSGADTIDSGRALSQFGPDKF